VLAAGGLNLDAVTIAELHGAMASGQLTARALTLAYLERIDALDAQLGSVLAVHPDALADAEASDARRRAGGTPRPLEGVPVLVKDNVAVAGLPTTAGSRALLDSMPADAPLVSRLRDSGVIILGKTNLSEWANFRDEHSTSGWSAVGGQTRNPHVLDRGRIDLDVGRGGPCGAQRSERRVEDVRHRRVEAGRAPHADARAMQGGAAQVRRWGATEHGMQQRGVGDVARDRAGGVLVGRERDDARARHGAERGLGADDAADAGRRDDRAVGLGADRDLGERRGDGCG